MKNYMYFVSRQKAQFGLLTVLLSTLSLSREAEEWQQKFETEKQKLLDNPQLKNEPRWYVPVTLAYSRIRRFQRVVERYEQGKTDPYYETEVHILRLGDIAFASHPFEDYLDFGIQIKVKSPALQTFIVQLAGSGTYLPSFRSTQGGGYGSVPASNPVGPEGGQILTDYTVEKIKEIWK